MPFCAPIWRLLFKGEKDATAAEKEASRERLEKGTTTAENKLKPNVDSKPRVLTKEEKLKEQRRKDIEQLRETLRRRRELLDGIVEVPIKKGTIEGYQIRVVRGPSHGVVKSPCNEPTMMAAKPQHTKESMEKFSRFIESKIKQMEEQTKDKDKGKAFDLKKQGNIPKDPVQDALIKRLLELQAERDVKRAKEGEKSGRDRSAERDVKKKAQSDQQKTKPMDENKIGKDHSKKGSGEKPKSQKGAHNEEGHKLKEVHTDKKAVEPSEKQKSEKEREKSGRDRSPDKEMKSNHDGKGKTTDTPKLSSKEATNTEKPARGGSPKSKEHSKGSDPLEQKHESTDAADPHNEKPQKPSKVEEGHHGHEENTNGRKHSKENGGGKHESTDIKTEKEGEEHAPEGGEPTVGKHRKSIKSKKSKDKK